MDETHNKFWAVFGKISAVFAFLATIGSVYVYISSPSGADLRVAVFPNMFVYPPGLENGLSEFRYELATYEMLDSITEDWLAEHDIEEGEAQKIAEKISGHLTRLWPESAPHGSLDQFNSYTYILLLNDGGAEAINTVIELPTSGLYSLQPEGADETVGEFNELIVVGSIRQGTRSVLRLWTRSLIDMEDIEKIKATHQSGMGDVRVAQPVFGLVDAVRTYVPIGKLWLWILGFWFVILVSSVFSSPKKGKKSSGGEAPSSEENKSSSRSGR